MGRHAVEVRQRASTRHLWIDGLVPRLLGLPEMREPGRSHIEPVGDGAPVEWARGATPLYGSLGGR
jgi:hypothetical protein